MIAALPRLREQRSVLYSWRRQPDHDRGHKVHLTKGQTADHSILLLLLSSCKTHERTISSRATRARWVLSQTATTHETPYILVLVYSGVHRMSSYFVYRFIHSFINSSIPPESKNKNTQAARASRVGHSPSAICLFFKIHIIASFFFSSLIMISPSLLVTPMLLREQRQLPAVLILILAVCMPT